jgi:polysaccharide export outer membrane protein
LFAQVPEPERPQQTSRDDSSDPTIQDYNRRLEQLRRDFSAQTLQHQTADYRIGPQDVIDISVFEAPELDRSLRVPANGEISIPLLGDTRALGLTAHELEQTLVDKLRVYIKDPHVGVLVSGIESHTVSVIGEVNKPGVFQVRGTKTLLEMLSLAQGLSQEAGDDVLVMRGAALHKEQDFTIGNAGSRIPVATGSAGAQAPNVEIPTSESQDNETIRINLKRLLDSRDVRYNVAVYPGDIVKVTRAGIVYVVGGVRRPGGFALKNNQRMSVLKAIALSEGLTNTSAKSHTRIIRTNEASGQRSEIPVDVGKILAGKAADVDLEAADIVFIPNSGAKSALYKGTDAIIATASGLVIFRPTF